MALVSRGQVGGNTEGYKARGRVGGRLPQLSPAQVRMARQLLENPDMTTQQVADALHVSRTTLYRALKRAEK